MQDKLTTAKLVAVLSSMGYDLITSTYKLVKADGKTMNNHRLSYYLKDTQNKTGKLTFIDGRSTFKNGLAIDIAITENKDLDRPLKLQNRGEFITILTIDNEKENELIEKRKAKIVQFRNIDGTPFYPEMSPEDKELINEKVNKEELNVCLNELQEYIRKTVMLSTDTLNKQIKDAYENTVLDLRTIIQAVVSNIQSEIINSRIMILDKHLEYSKKINCDIWYTCIVLCLIIMVCTVIIYLGH